MGISVFLYVLQLSHISPLQAFAKRVDKRKGKKKELSPQDAAILIQKSFRAYLIQRSQTLRALRELAIAKTKLKEIRALFNNFSYRRRLVRNAEELQRFSEKIIVLLLTVDAIEVSYFPNLALFSRSLFIFIMIQ